MPAYRCSALSCRRITFQPPKGLKCRGCGAALTKIIEKRKPQRANPHVQPNNETDRAFRDFPRGKAAADLCGFPLALRHLDAFQHVANTMKTVIVSRAVGMSCRAQIEEGYSMKDFRIHGKSCDFGPMAGFVCMDPRLNKKGMAGLEYNAKAHLTALAGVVQDQPTFEAFGTQGGAMSMPSKRLRTGAWKASVVPLFISEARRVELMAGWGSDRPLGSKTKKQQGGDWVGVCEKITNSDTLTVPWRLIRTAVNGKSMWAVCIDDSVSFSQKYPALGMISDQQKREKLKALLGTVPTADSIKIPMRRSSSTGRAYPQVMGMANATNYLGTTEKDDTPISKKAITGDYDLFSVWPKIEDYETQGLDKRLGPMHSLDKESQIRGNVSQRVTWAGALLNKVCNEYDALGYHRIVCHHSDENYRPFIGDVDLPLIAFVPDARSAIGISDLAKFKSFVDNIMALEYRPSFNPGWIAEMAVASMSLQDAKKLLTGSAAAMNLVNLSWIRTLEKKHNVNFTELAKRIH